MERLWTPWRRAYVTGNKGKGCFLCDKAWEDNDHENLVLFRSSHCYVLLNTFPYNAGHVMVAPYVHTGNFPALQPEIGLDMWTVTQKVTNIIKAEYAPEGFNLGLNLGKAGGAGVVDHIHMHIVPRWVGDTNFMPLVGGTKVLPETLPQTWDRLRPLFDKGG